ncbi:unnamed protein product [Ilex paraguariensis]|uniref:RING-type domain-containing protein n=1 Tax=Ilex paraguariensis TaxID=185542 RepID=A0ABC8TVR3_9AQUA
MASSQDSQPFHWHSDFDDRNFQIRGRTVFFVIVLLSLIVLVTLLILYARWVCRFRPPFAADLHHAPPAPPQGLDPATIHSLPIILHRSSATTTITSINEVECCICLGIFQDGDKVKVLPECHHSYHSQCVDKWLRTQSNCPLCRASLQGHSAV